jgi:hypothetical protein
MHGTCQAQLTGYQNKLTGTATYIPPAHRPYCLTCQLHHVCKRQPIQLFADTTAASLSPYYSLVISYSTGCRNLQKHQQSQGRCELLV